MASPVKRVPRLLYAGDVRDTLSMCKLTVKQQKKAIHIRNAEVHLAGHLYLPFLYRPWYNDRVYG